jgi:hypothetical protein
MFPKNFVDYVPKPEPVSSDYLIACHYFPGWNVHENGYSGFSRITDFPERTPLMGYYDEADPEVSDWEIKWAVEHGINCFVYCWYRRWNNVGKPVTKNDINLAHQLDALLKAKYSNMMKFAIMWEGDNAGVALDESDLLDNLLPFWVENYFKLPNYLKIDNKPVLFVYDWSFKVINYMGGEEKLKHALDAAREKIKEYGFDGIIFQVEYRYDDKAVLQMYKNAGFDNTFAYCWHTLERMPSQEEVIDRQLYLMNNHLEFDKDFTIFTCSQSWDPYPWHRTNTERVRKITRWKLTPNNWRKLLEKVKEMTDEMPDTALGKRFVMMDNWNEWGEGHYIAPHLSGGFKYLQAIREVFTKRDNLPDYRLPQQLGLGPYDSKIDLEAEP